MQSPSKCPECGELYMTRKLVILPCNHILHKKCYLKIYDNAIDTNISIQCPVCHEEWDDNWSCDVKSYTDISS